MNVRRRAWRGIGPPLLGSGLVFLALFLSPRTAHAYLDPGTGSALVYVVSGLVVSGYIVTRGLYHRALELLLRRRFGRHRSDIVIHSEDRRYETTFMPILRALAKRGIEVSYMTMYERDTTLEPLPEGVTHQAIPPGLVGYSFLNHVEAKLFVTTTPQVDVMMFRRSKRVKHYCIVQHALGESRFVRPFAYDFFDSVLCCGPLLGQNIRKIEAIRRLPPKQLFETGIPHYDELFERARKPERARENKTVLIAPSWGPMSLFQVFGTDFVREVAERHRVIVRPHPQMKVSQAELYEKILSLEGVTVDTAPTPVNAISEADIVVSDISGIAYEFAFIHERPVLVVEHEIGIDGLEGHFLRDVMTLRQRCAEFIIALSPSEMRDLPNKIDEVLRQDMSDRIARSRGELLYNVGKAGEVAADQLEGIVKCL